MLAKAPLRVSLAGGGTDLPSYADSFGGAVVSLAIDRYVCVAVHPRSFDSAVHASWEYAERADDVAELRHALGRAALMRHGVANSVQLATFGDVPSGTGLGGSAAFTVALLHALGGTADPSALAEEASALEMVTLNRPVGKHDHYMAALGGLQRLTIARERSVTAAAVPLSDAVRDYIDNRLLLFYTGQRRDAGRVLAQQADQAARGAADVLRCLHTIRELVEPMLDALRSDRVDRIGPLLDAHWRAKKQLSGAVSNGEVDRLYRAALESGADGGKLLGAGGGGFLLLSAGAGTQPELRRAMAAVGAHELEFRIEQQGTRSVRLGL